MPAIRKTAGKPTLLNSGTLETSMRDYASSLPVLLDLDLINAGWNGAVNPYPGIDCRQFAMQSQRKALMKKFCEKTIPAADKRALDLFLKINQSCKNYTFDTSSVTEAEAIAIGEAKEFISRIFYEADPSYLGYSMMSMTTSSISDGFGLGNGANIGSFGTDFLSKVGTSTMAASNPLLHNFYMQAISEDPIWSDVESIRSVTRGFEVVRGSRLSFVPKTTDISRTICTEPICNMLFQKGIANILEGRLQQVSGIDLRVQPDKNRKLAQLGSQNGRFGTIDLSSASDSMSLSLVREFFPRHAVWWFEQARSPVTILPDGTEVELHMVSSMGNAFTFPLQTIFFASLVYGAYRVLDIKIEYPFRHALGNFAVFGDDIIVESRAYNLVCRLLMLCGFSVNVDKSFNEGLFRESCGHDYYCGYNVRGVYLKSLLDVNDKYSAINRLNVWSAKHRIPLPETIQFLVKGCRFLPVPFDEMDISGIKVHSSHLRKVRRNRYTGGIHYRYSSFIPTAQSVSDIELRPPKIRGWIKNPPAVLLAALAGTLRTGKVVTRSSRPSTRIRERYSSRWDYIPPGQGLCPGFGEDWKVFVESNLNLKD